MIGIIVKNSIKSVLVVFSLALFPIFASASTLISEQYSITPKGNGVGEGVTFSSENYSIRSGSQITSDSDDSVAVEDGGRSGGIGKRVTTTPNFNIFPEFIVGLQKEQLPQQEGKMLNILETDPVPVELVLPTETNDTLSEVNTRGEDTRDMRFTASAIGAWVGGQFTAYLESLGDLFEERSARASVLVSVIAILLLLRRTVAGRKYFPF